MENRTALTVLLILLKIHNSGFYPGWSADGVTQNTSMMRVLGRHNPMGPAIGCNAVTHLASGPYATGCRVRAYRDVFTAGPEARWVAALLQRDESLLVIKPREPAVQLPPAGISAAHGVTEQTYT